MSDYIVYIKILKNKRLVIGKMKLAFMNGANYPIENLGSGKLIYFEIKKNVRAAEAAENKLKSLKRNKLIERIRNTNPELLDLKNTIYDSSYLKELIY